LGLDRATGRFASRQDTVYYGIFSSFSVTADGASLALDDGTYDFSAWAVDLADALHGRFPDARRVLRASTAVGTGISPDGQRLLLYRTLPTAAGQSEVRLSVMPFGGGAEVPVRYTGTLLGAKWQDSVTLEYAGQTKTGLHLALADVRSGAERHPLDLGDSLVQDFAALPDGWAWIPVGGQRIVVQGAAGRREIGKPAWAGSLTWLATMADGRSLSYTSWNAGTFDTMRVDVVPATGGSATPWVSMFSSSVT
jgi:hypothetical protein